MGHNVGGLDDEYTEYQQNYPGGAYLARNVTQEPSLDQIPWASLVAPRKEIPSVPDSSGVGLFEGAGYYTGGLYRPAAYCMMVSGLRYCPVCTREVEIRLAAITNVLPTPSGMSPAWCIPAASPVFSWDDKAGAALWQFQLERESDGALLAEYQLYETAFTLPFALLCEDGYQWRIRAGAEGQWGSWSAWISFVSGCASGPDLDGDGKTDILWRNYATGENYVWYMDGAAKTGSAPLDAVGDAAWKMAGAADFTGDGKADVLWRNTSSGQVYIWTMDGVAKTNGSDLGVVPLEWEIRWTADYSGDGNPDILWRNTATGDNHVWYVAGAVQVGGAALEPVGDLAWEIMPQIYPAAGGWKAGDLYDVDAVVGNLRYVPSTVEAGARLPRWLAGGFLQGSPADEPCREP